MQSESQEDPRKRTYRKTYVFGIDEIDKERTIKIYNQKTVFKIFWGADKYVLNHFICLRKKITYDAMAIKKKKKNIVSEQLINISWQVDNFDEQYRLKNLKKNRTIIQTYIFENDDIDKETTNKKLF